MQKNFFVPWRTKSEIKKVRKRVYSLLINPSPINNDSLRLSLTFTVTESPALAVFPFDYLLIFTVTRSSSLKLILLDYLWPSSWKTANLNLIPFIYIGHLILQKMQSWPWFHFIITTLLSKNFNLRPLLLRMCNINIDSLTFTITKNRTLTMISAYYR